MPAKRSKEGEGPRKSARGSLSFPKRGGEEERGVGRGAGSPEAQSGFVLEGDLPGRGGSRERPLPGIGARCSPRPLPSLWKRRGEPGAGCGGAGEEGRLLAHFPSDLRWQAGAGLTLDPRSSGFPRA